MAIILFFGGITAVIVLSKSKSKDPAKPATTSSGATTKTPDATTKTPDATKSSGATTKHPATKSSGSTTNPPDSTLGETSFSLDATSSGSTTKLPDATLGEKEVYYANKGGTYAFTTLADAETYATSLGGTIARFDQLVEAYQKGLNQCSFAWGVTDQIKGGAIYTVTTKQMNDDTCRFPQGGVTEFFPNHPEWTNHPKVTSGGVWVYGVKKPKAQSMDCANSNVPCLLPFSETKWSQYD